MNELTDDLAIKAVEDTDVIADQAAAWTKAQELDRPGT